MLWMLLTLSQAHAADCAELKTAVEEATPARIATKWVELADCDEEMAAETAEHAFTTALAGTDAHPAVLRAVELGLDEHARGFLRRIAPDERSKALDSLEGACDDSEAVGAFFVSTHEEIGAAFWEERWHRGLAGCRVEPVRELLTAALKSKEVGQGSHNRGLFFSVLEVYARNLRADALPTLQSLASELEDEEEITYVISAFADAAGVGAAEGVDHDTAQAAVSAIEELGPELPERGVEQARTILLALGDEQASDAYARYRWPAAYRLGGYAYRYAVVATEVATCRNGKKMAIAHHADFTEPGNLWPDQVGQMLPEKLTFEWRLDGSNLCKGEHEVTFTLPNEPFQTDEARNTWIEDQLTAFRASTSGFKKATVQEQDDLEL